MSWSLLKAGGIAAAALLLAWLVYDRFALSRQVAAFELCTKAAAADTLTTDPCAKPVAERIIAARRAAACDAALTAGNTYAVGASCSGQVKALGARAETALANLSDAQAQLARNDRDRDAAIGRAEARATATATRNTRNAEILTRAPRTADGRVHCDSECVRKLAGQSPPGPS